MQDSPTCEELLVAIADFLETEIMPAHDGRTAFQVRIAASLCRILARETGLELGFLEAEHTALSALRGKGEPTPKGSQIGREVRALVTELAQSVASGASTTESPGVFEAVEMLVRHKLLVVNPAYLEADAPNEVNR